MHPTTVRFSDQLWGLVSGEAREEGVTVSHYIRESVLARVVLAEVRRGGGRDWDRAIRVARDLLREGGNGV